MSAWRYTFVERMSLLEAVTLLNGTQGGAMPRNVGERYECEQCGAVLVYENPCPCASESEHSKVCCDKPMKKVVQSK